jgi:hypothetical protein
VQAQELAESYPINADQYFDGDFEKWAEEGYKISIESVYPGKYWTLNLARFLTMSL